MTTVGSLGTNLGAPTEDPEGLKLKKKKKVNARGKKQTKKFIDFELGKIK